MFKTLQTTKLLSGEATLPCLSLRVQNLPSYQASVWLVWPTLALHALSLESVQDGAAVVTHGGAWPVGVHLPRVGQPVLE